MALTTGTRIGGYEVTALLGAGAMGEVYRARDTRLGREVAIKLLPEEVSSKSDSLARFEREARVVAALNHPNIVVLYSMEEDAGTLFLTMELVEGENLAGLITPGGLPVRQVLEIAIPLADALAAAHEKGVVHRDLKPANVMMAREGRIKVLDFGLAKLAEASDLLGSASAATASPISHVGLVVGTVPYMAPEQICGEPVDARTDLFSFGILIYELLAGSRPFTGPTFTHVAHAILRGTPPPLASLRSDVPAALESLISRCLEKQPGERFQSALELADKLRELRRTLERGVQKAADNVASIAVLPFVNRSASAEDEYFSDGLADELLNMLAKIRGLRVAARTSAFHFKGKDTTIAEIGKALNVETVLEGSVRKAGRRVRISVHLVEVADGYHLWSQTYDRMLDDIFEVQDDIAQSVVAELRSTLLGEALDATRGEVRAEVAQAAKGRGTDPKAHRLYLKARHFIERFTRTDTEKAIALLEQALEWNPEFALAWAELAWARVREADSGWVSIDEGYGRARAAAEQALRLEPDLAEGHAAMAWIQRAHEWDWRGAETSLQRALDLAPGNALVLRRAGWLAMTRGRLHEAIELNRRALKQDPLSASTCYNFGMVLHAAAHHDEAESIYRKALELAPNRNGTRGLLSLTLLAQGRGEEALSEAMQETDEGFRLYALAIIEAQLNHRAESEDALRRLVAEFADSSAYQIAEVHGARGDLDPAFEWLEHAYAQRDPGLTEMKASPRLRSLHLDPRWSAFLEKLGLEK